MHTRQSVAVPAHVQLNAVDATAALLFIPSLLLIVAVLVAMFASINPWSRTHPTVPEQLEAEARARTLADALDQPTFQRISGTSEAR